jgi:hypothetical protein
MIEFIAKFLTDKTYTIVPGSNGTIEEWTIEAIGVAFFVLLFYVLLTLPEPKDK